VARANKITIRVSPNRRDEDITWTATGQFGALNLSTTSGQLLGQPLTSAASADAYWAAVLTAVLSQL
jgi:hypothetical protein